MTDTDYARMVSDSLGRLAELIKKRNETNAEITKTRQFIRATANMLPLSERKQFEKQLRIIASEIGGLTEAIKDALGPTEVAGCYMTSAEVRDSLLRMGFDFSHYRSNPLASVSTVLTRLHKADAIEVRMINEVAAYALKRRKGYDILRIGNVPTIKKK